MTPARVIELLRTGMCTTRQRQESHCATCDEIDQAVELVEAAFASILQHEEWLRVASESLEIGRAWKAAGKPTGEIRERLRASHDATYAARDASIEARERFLQLTRLELDTAAWKAVVAQRAADGATISRLERKVASLEYRLREKDGRLQHFEARANTLDQISAVVGFDLGCPDGGGAPVLAAVQRLRRALECALTVWCPWGHPGGDGADGETYELCKRALGDEP